MTTEKAIEILKAHSVAIWEKFEKSPYDNKKAFAKHAIEKVKELDRFLKDDGTMPLFAVLDVFSSYSEVIHIEGEDKITNALRKKYMNTAAMALV